MGTTSVQVQVGHVQGGQWLDVEALVDTGSTHTVIPQETAQVLGIERLEAAPFQLADDRTVEYEVGEARVRLGDRERTVLVVVGESGVGAVAGGDDAGVVQRSSRPCRETADQGAGVDEGDGGWLANRSYGWGRSRPHPGYGFQTIIGNDGMGRSGRGCAKMGR